MPVTLQKLKIVHNQRLAALTEFLTFSAKLRIQMPESWFSSEKDLFSDSECVSNTPLQFTQIPLHQRLLVLLNKRFSFYQKSEGENKWRRERDSNPRYGCPYSDFRDRRLRPLSHLSACTVPAGAVCLHKISPLRVKSTPDMQKISENLVAFWRFSRIFSDNAGIFRLPLVNDGEIR